MGQRRLYRGIEIVRPEEIIGQPVARLIPEDRLEEEAQILARLRRGERVDHFETVRRRKDGTLVDVSVSKRTLFERQNCGHLPHPNPRKIEAEE